MSERDGSARRGSARISMVGGFFLLLVAAAWAVETSYEVVDPDGIYFRSVRGRHPKAPAVLEADVVWAAIPEYRKIVDEGLTEDDARYHLLLKKATERFNKALKKLAKRDAYDMLGEVGAIAAHGEEPAEIPMVTDDLAELVSRE